MLSLLNNNLKATGNADVCCKMSPGNKCHCTDFSFCDATTFMRVLSGF